MRKCGEDLKTLDKIIGLLLIVSVVIAPWILGATTKTGILVLNFLNCLIGVCFLCKLVMRLKVRQFWMYDGFEAGRNGILILL